MNLEKRKITVVFEEHPHIYGVRRTLYVSVASALCGLIFSLEKSIVKKEQTTVSNYINKNLEFRTNHQN